MDGIDLEVSAGDVYGFLGANGSGKTTTVRMLLGLVLPTSGDVQLLYRHYSVSESPQELGFYGAEAAAAQGYGWQYTYLFFRNQSEAKRFGIDQDYLDSVAGGIEELNEPEWLSYLEGHGGSDGAISKQLQSYDELGTELGIRTRQAAIVNGPGGTRTLQDGPSLAQIEAAIEAVQ